MKNMATASGNRIAWASVLLILMAVPSWALDHYSNVAQDQNGRAVSGATIAVYQAGTTTLVTLYADNGITAKANPFTTGIDGVYDFYAPDGRYDITIQKTGYTSIYWDPAKLRGLTLFDPAQHIVPFGGTLPTTPENGSVFVLLSNDGSCTPVAGSLDMLCRYDSSSGTWAAIGGNGGGGETPGLSAVLAVDRIDGDAVSEATAFSVGSSSANAYMVTYYDSTDGLIHTCKVGGTLDNCNKMIKLLSGKKFFISNSSATEIFTVSESGAITNATINAESIGNTITLKRYKWFPAAGCNNATASTIWDLPVSNPAVAACRTGTNTTKGVLEFADGSDLSAQLTEYLFEDWNGVIDATIIYEANSTSTNNVVWQLAIACAGDADSDDPAFTYDEFTADSGKATAHQYNATVSNAITTTGTCAAGDVMHMAVRRNSAHASDNLAATAKLVGVALKLREAQ